MHNPHHDERWTMMDRSDPIQSITNQNKRTAIRYVYCTVRCRMYTVRTRYLVLERCCKLVTNRPRRTEETDTRLWMMMMIMMMIHNLSSRLLYYLWLQSSILRESRQQRGACDITCMMLMMRMKMSDEWMRRMREGWEGSSLNTNIIPVL